MFALISVINLRRIFVSQEDDLMNAISDVKVENLSNWLKSLRLNSGAVIHIPPRSTSQVIAAVEVQNNPEIDKLLGQCAIAVHEVAVSTSEVQSPPDIEAGPQ